MCLCVPVEKSQVLTSTKRVNTPHQSRTHSCGTITPSSPYAREVVKEGLEGALPSDAHEIMNNRKGTVTVGITQLFPRPQGVFVSKFESRDDLIEVLLGSW